MSSTKPSDAAARSVPVTARPAAATQTDYDVVIAGGGMVGVSLALSLVQSLPPGRRIMLAESFPLPAKDSEFGHSYTPSFDARTTALSYSSVLIYQRLQLWSNLSSRACAIAGIHVSDRGRFGSTRMLARDYQWPALGYVVENAWLGNVLIQCLRECETVDVRSPARILCAEPGAGSIQLELEDGSRLSAGLLVVADGAESNLRTQLGVASVQRDYQQHALIANVAHQQAHAGCAYERFTDRGPLAMLPLLDDLEGGPRSALIWTLPSADAAHLQQCPEDEFLAVLQDRFGYRLGRLQRVGERHSYPLTLQQSSEQVRRNVVIMGNAAHTLHPVAGQGFNLALRDVYHLSQVLARAGASDDIGELELLQTYLNAQRVDQQRTVSFSDRLPGLFMHRDPAVAMARDLGLALLDLSPALKQEFVRYTAGVASLGDMVR